MGNEKKAPNQSKEKLDEEMFKNLDLLLSLDELEESDFWDEMMNLGEIETEQSEGAKESRN